jgi:hypothetical protein
MKHAESWRCASKRRKIKNPIENPQKHIGAWKRMGGERERF